ncbi:hypothetical protein BN946_scf185014.g106 [Trametes cinnabarina]|uniref:BAH domain-containing protein n=1 Tax=Pycnoporus cinnabarinus TaxID=5643 RepID=A0A060SHF1_PYCCI|nr:hypothetical protein BN946_scf185014.g106 [Trametes cinnabarina]
MKRYIDLSDIGPVRKARVGRDHPKWKMPTAEVYVEVPKNVARSSARGSPLTSFRDDSKQLRDPEKSVLQHKNATCVTPRVNAVTQKLFTQALRVAQLPADLVDVPLEVRKRRVHHTDPTSIEWDDTSMTIPNHYGRVVIDGERYSVGDIVIVEPGYDSDHRRARNASSHEARCHDNALADTKWFCQISYMFEVQGASHGRRKMFHARWLQHGSQTLLQEAAHSRGLFWLNACDDVPLECIFSHCNVCPWRSGEPAPLDDEAGDPNHFFIGPTWDSERVAFVKSSAAEDDCALRKCKVGKPCVSCGIAALEEEREEWRTLPDDTISCSGVVYHPHDFVYLHTPGQVIGLLAIVQILGFIPDESGAVSQVKIRHYGRYDTVAVKHSRDEGPIPRDNRRLFQTGVITAVPVKYITGKAYVAGLTSPWEKEAFVRDNDHFYCDLWSESLRPASLDELEVLSPKPGVLQCTICMSTAMEAMLERDRLFKMFGPLKGLELFAGAGGLSTGMEMSGIIQTKWAVEFSPAAARTFG